MNGSMPGRTVRDIVEEWRAAEREMPADPSEAPPEVLARIEALRAEHATAMAREADHAAAERERARRDRADHLPF